MRFRAPVSVLVASIFVAISATAAHADPGDLDTTFSTDGKRTVDLTTGFDAGWKLAIQDDGKIVVGGQAAGQGIRWALARLNPDGTLDTTFSGDGKVFTNWTAQYDAVWGLAIQDDGKIVAAGDVGIGSGNSMFGVARYNADGTLDTAFGGGDGKATTQFTVKDDAVADMTLQDDGKIVVVGVGAAGGANPRFAVARYNPDGTLDTTFSGDGKVLTDITVNKLDWANAVAVQDDGKIVAGGVAEITSTNSKFALVRYNPDGTLDTTFSGDGKQTTNFTAWSDSLLGLAVQADQKIVAAGSAAAGGTNPRFALARYNADGTLDTTFSGDGKQTTQFTTGSDWAYDLVVQGDQEIVAVGFASGQGGRFALARYATDGTLDASFGTGGKVFTNFTAQVDAAWAVDIDANGDLVVAGYSGASSTTNSKFAVARYLAT
ncbi:MAG: hypothetical protein HY658_04895 [Actinobacteria bacterium]|nr:hypothetical protein [Actinomycetota bacterium]